MSLNIAFLLLLFIYVASPGIVEANDGTGLYKLVLGGGSAIPDKNKHLVKLIISHQDKNKKYCSSCSGSIISAKWILTAAHCFKDVSKITVKKFIHDKLQTIARENKDSVLIMKDYDFQSETAENAEKDIALVKFSPYDGFDADIKAIKLAKKTIKSNESAIIAGFGLSEEKRKCKMLEPRQGIVTMTDKCFFTKGTTLLCSQDYVRAGNGDSGGSLISKGVLVGITSMGDCDDKPNYKDWKCETYYVDVVPNLPWITKVLDSK